MWGVTKSGVEVPQLDMEVHESPVKEYKYVHPTKRARERELLISTSIHSKLQRNPSIRIVEDQNSFQDKSKALCLQENNSIPEMQKITDLEENPDIPSVSLEDETKSKLHSDSDVSQPFNLQEELDKMASLDETSQIVKIDIETNNPANLKEKK
jgi:galactose mutarotase-like enzyme